MELRRVLSAAKTTSHYVGMLPTNPRETKAFVGNVIEYVAGYSHVAMQPEHLPQRSLQDILPGINDMRVCFKHVVEPKVLPYGEAYLLASITRYLRPSTIFEIGTFSGAGTILMAEQAEPECRIYTLDLPPNVPTLSLPGLRSDPPEADSARIGARFRGTKYEHQITQLYGDSATFDFAPYAGSIDLMLVDGSHSFEYVTSDSARALKMLAPGGTILWDDCSPTYPDVVRALDRLGAQLEICRISDSRFAIHRSGELV